MPPSPPAKRAKKVKKRKASLRLTEDGYAHIERRAAKADVTTAHMHRRMLAYSAIHMPENWVPPT